MVVAQEKIAARIGADVLKRGRQRDRCRGRHRLRHGGDLSARRQYRRRRLHGDPSRRNAMRTSRSIIARPRRPRPRRVFFLGPTANRTTPSRAIPRSASAFPAHRRDWRWRWRNTAPGKFTLAELMRPAIDLARDGDRAGRRQRRHAAGLASTAGALAIVGKDLFPRRRHIVARGRHAGPDRSGSHAHRRSAAQGPRGFYEGPVAEKLVKAIRDAGGIMTLG